jgi:hypothetical protein
VVVLVLGTFPSASVTKVGTKTANFFDERRSPAHECRRCPAQRRTIPVGADAVRHHGDIILGETGIGTVFASLGALHAGFDASCEFFVRHDFLLFQKTPK